MTNGPSALGTPIVFKGKWLGGTGKFEGLSGDIEIRPTPVLVSDTLVQGTGKKTGTYIIAKSPAAQRESFGAATVDLLAAPSYFRWVSAASTRLAAVPRTCASLIDDVTGPMTTWLASRISRSRWRPTMLPASAGPKRQ
jgi:hypothetical protein